MLGTHQCCLKHGVNVALVAHALLWSHVTHQEVILERVPFKRFASRVRRCGQVIEASVPSDDSERKMTRTFKREGARFVPGESDDEEEEPEAA